MVIPERNMFLKWLGDIWKISKYLCENDMNTSNYSNKSKNKIEYLKKNKIKSLFLWENEIYEFKSNLDIIILNKINEESQNIQGVS